MNKFPLCTVLLLFFSISVCLSEERDTLVWLTWNQKPNYIFSGKFKGQGIAGSLMKAIQDSLPQYVHRVISTNAERYNELIKNEETCVAWAWKVPNSRNIRIYSKPISLLAPMGIITLKEKQHKFDDANEILSLEKLLADTTLTLGYLAGMPYSQKIMELLDKHKESPNIYISRTSAIEFNLKMLDLNRVDYFIGISQQPIFDALNRGVQNKYKFYNIEEDMDFTPMYVNTSKSDLGTRVMSDIEKILTNELLLDHLEVIERWSGENKNYRSIFIDYIIRQNSNSMVKDGHE